jgi:hypothetical protein
MIVADFSLVHALKSCFEQFHFGIVKLLSFFSAFLLEAPLQTKGRTVSGQIVRT